jgi:methylmalonyl-CoA/ethylmalonyl-CoA epimerase
MAAPLVAHVGIAVADLEAAIGKYSVLLGRQPNRVENVPEMSVRVAVFAGDDIHGGFVELLAPINPDNSIARFLERRGEGLHHVCIHVADIEKKLSELKALGYRLIDETPRIGALGHRIAFVHPSASHGVLIELEEAPKGAE